MGSPPLVAPALSPRLRLGPRLAPQEAGRPTLCGGSAARPRVAPTFCRVFPTGPAYGNCRARSPLSPASLRAVSESSSATHRSAWISTTGTSLSGTCPSSQVRAPAGAGEVLEDVEGRRVKPVRQSAGVTARGFEEEQNSGKAGASVKSFTCDLETSVESCSSLFPKPASRSFVFSAFPKDSRTLFP